LEQSFRDFELIVIDDGSTDDSVAIIEKYAARDTRIRFLRNDVNSGVIFTLNRCLSEARADWVLGAAADDYVLPGFFEAAMAMLRRYPQAGLCTGRCVHMGGDDQVRCVAPALWAGEPTFFAPGQMTGLMKECAAIGPSIWKRKAFLEAGGYHGALRWHCDWFPIQMVGLRYGICFLPQRTVIVRDTDDCYSAGRTGYVQRKVLTEMLRELRSERLRDLLPAFADSCALGQHCPELLRAIACNEAYQDAAMVGALGWAFLKFGPSLLRDDPEWEVRCGIAHCLGLLGAWDGHVFEAVAEATRDRNKKVATAAANARRALLRLAPLGWRVGHMSRRARNIMVHSVKKLMRPGAAYLYRKINHKLYSRIQRLERDSAELGEMVREIKQRLERVDKQSANAVAALRDN
jgi:hypothetical protein